MTFRPAILVALLLTSRAVVGGSFSASVDYDKGAAVDVDQSVGAVFALTLSEVPDVKRLDIESTTGRCTAVLSFDDRADLAAKMREAARHLAEVAPLFPSGCGSPRLAQGDPDALPRVWIGLSSEKLDAVELTNAAEEAAKRWAKTPDATDARVFGRSERRTALRLDPKKLAAFNATVDDVRRCLEEAPAGNAASVLDAVIRTANGVPLRVREVGRVEDLVDADGLAAVNGKLAVLVALSNMPPNDSSPLHPDPGDRDVLMLRKGVRFAGLLDIARRHCLVIELREPEKASVATSLALARQVGEAVSVAAPDDVFAFKRAQSDRTFYIVSLPQVSGVEAALRNRLAKIPSISFRTCEVGAKHGRVPFPVRVALVGPDRARLRDWADAVTQRMTKERAALDAEADGWRAVKRLEIDPDREIALGLIKTRHNAALQLANEGLVSVRGALKLDLQLEPDAADPMSAGLMVRSSRGEPLPLGAVARAVSVQAPVVYRRFGASPALRITATAPDGVTTAEALTRCLKIAEEERARLKIAGEYQAVDDGVAAED